MKQWLNSIITQPIATAKNLANANKDPPSKTSAANPKPAPGYEHDQALHYLLRHVRSKLVRKHFFELDAREYVDEKPVRVVAGTYNVNGRKPPPGVQLSEWLGQWVQGWPQEGGAQSSAGGSSHGGTGGADIVAIGFQEVVPLNAGNVIVGGAADGAYAWDRVVAAALNGEEWATEKFPGTHPAPNSPEQAEALIDALDHRWSSSSLETPPLTPPTHFQDDPTAPAPPPAAEEGRTYVQIVGKQMVGIYLTVWARASLADHISGVQSTVVATGFGGYLGNKGAVAVRMRVYNSPLCLVAAHLSSGANEGDEGRRNLDYSEVLRRCAFPPTTESVDATTYLKAVLRPGHWGDARGLLEQENVIWVGDLNYRLNMPDEDVRRHLRANNLAPLLAADQLLREMAAGRAFEGWSEARITFPPTFKYRLGSTKYLGDEPHLPHSASQQSGLNDEASDSDVASSRSASPGPPDGPLLASAAGPTATAAAGAAAAAPVTGAAGQPPALASAAMMQAAGALSASLRALGPLEAGLARFGTGNPGAASAGGALGPGAAPGAPGGAGGGVEDKQKRRTPAWCDRVLWRSSPELQVVSYSRGELTASDHRPVAAAFVLKARRYNKEKVQQQLEAARRKVDLLEMSLRPKVHVEPNSLPLGPVQYQQPCRSTLQLHNTGTVDATFYFMPLPASPSKGLRPAHEAEEPLFPPWLSVTPDEGVLPAGTALDLNLRVEVTGGPHGCADAAAVDPALETILIIRVDGAGDMFAHIAATYDPVSAFGRRLDSLPCGAPPAHLAPHLAVAPQDMLLDCSPPPSPGAQHIAALLNVLPEFRSLEPHLPQVIQLLVSRLATEGCLQAKGIFADSPRIAAVEWATARAASGQATAAPADHSDGSTAHAEGAAEGALEEPAQQVAQLFLSSQHTHERHMPHLLAATAAPRQALDAGTPIPPDCSPHLLAASLLALCAELPAPLIPSSVVDEIQTCPLPPAALATLLSEALPPLHWDVLRLLLRLARAALQPPASLRNHLSLHALASTLATYWLAPIPPSLQGVHGVVQQRQQLLMLLLEPDLELVGRCKAVRAGSDAHVA